MKEKWENISLEEKVGYVAIFSLSLAVIALAITLISIVITITN